MAFNKFRFDPEGGFYDTSYYEDTPADPREILQRQHDQTRDYINSLVDTLGSSDEGRSGSENIASPSVEGLAGNTVFSQIKDLKRQMVDTVSGVIPDGSISSVKLSSESVISEKIAPGAVETKHFSEDAVSPKSQDTIKVNGRYSYEYEPVLTSGAIGMFKERVSDRKFSTVRGKTYGGYRYMVNYDGIISRLSLNNFGYETVADFSEYSSNPVIAFDESGILHAAFIESLSSKYYFSVYKFSQGEFVRLARVYLFDRAGNYSSSLLGMEIHNRELYIFVRYVSAKDYIYIWRVSMESLDNSDSYEHIVSEIAGSKNIYPFIYNGDLYSGYRVYMECDPENYSEHEGLYFEGIDGIGFLSGNDAFLIYDENYYPAVVSLIGETLYPGNCFYYGKYLYMLFGNFLFRARII